MKVINNFYLIPFVISFSNEYRYYQNRDWDLSDVNSEDWNYDVEEDELESPLGYDNEFNPSGLEYGARKYPKEWKNNQDTRRYHRYPKSEEDSIYDFGLPTYFPKNNEKPKSLFALLKEPFDNNQDIMEEYEEYDSFPIYSEERSNEVFLKVEDELKQEIEEEKQDVDEIIDMIDLLVSRNEKDTTTHKHKTVEKHITIEEKNTRRLFMYMLVFGCLVVLIVLLMFFFIVLRNLVSKKTEKLDLEDAPKEDANVVHETCYKHHLDWIVDENGRASVQR